MSDLKRPPTTRIILPDVYGCVIVERGNTCDSASTTGNILEVVTVWYSKPFAVLLALQFVNVTDVCKCGQHDDFTRCENVLDCFTSLPAQHAKIPLIQVEHAGEMWPPPVIEIV